MGIYIKELTRHRCVVSAPLKENHNHKGTAFGGSLFAACTVACYGLLYSLANKTKSSPLQIVITEARIVYSRPIQEDFIATAELKTDVTEKLLERLQAQKPGRYSMSVEVAEQSATDKIAVRFFGDFAFVL